MSAVYDPAVLITSEERGVYDARDVSKASAIRFYALHVALRRLISNFNVEFLYTDSGKPRVVFRLDFIPLLPNTDPLNHALVSMELRTGQDSRKEGPGACQIELCMGNAIDRTRRVSAGFRFRLLRRITLLHMIDLINGDHSALPSGMRGDLKRFEFLASDGYFNGCRDWV
jgi:hypothetical protein